jgi:SSS family solute:Na+ symporter
VSGTLALPKMILSLNPVAAGLTLAALWAADVSTACSLLLGASTLFTQDIYKSFINPGMKEENSIIMNKTFVILIGILTFILALSISGILKAISIGLSLSTAFTIVFLFTVFAPNLCRKSSAFYTTLTGITVLFLWELIPSFRIFPHVIYMEWLSCLCVFFLISLIDKRAISTTKISKSIKNVI